MLSLSMLEKYKNLVGEHNVLTDYEDLKQHSLDAFGRWRLGTATPKNLVSAVVKPSSTNEVVELVRLSNTWKIPIIPFGAGTGVMGAITPSNGGIAIDLKRMCNVIGVDTISRTATVEAGIILGDLEEALNAEGFLLGHDPYSLPIATIGGAISTNGVGYRASKYGSMGEQVLGMEVVLPTGDVLKTKAIPKTSVGPALQSMFIGSEGTFGIITQATVKIFKTPEIQTFKTFSFSDFEHGFHAMVEMFSIGLIPALVDLTEEKAETPRLLTNGDKYKTFLYLLFEGYLEEVEAQLKRISVICSKFDGVDIGREYSEEYWVKRHDSAYRYKDRFIDRSSCEWPRDGDFNNSAYPHVAIPASRILEYKSKSHEILAKANIEVREYSSWTKPELFSLMLINMNLSAAGDSAFLGVLDELLALAQDLGGSMEYVHGVGSRLSHLVARELGYGMEFMKQIKATVDPNSIMNPGNLGM